MSTDHDSADANGTDGSRGLKEGSDEANGTTPQENGDDSTWWDEEDLEEPWAFQATRLLPKTTLALWQLTP